MLASMKLIDLVESHAEQIARQWSGDVVKHQRTPFYHDLPRERIIPQAIQFYDNFRRIFTAKNPYEAAGEFFSRYAEARYNEGIPMHEAIYALILMRRHIWLYAEFQAIFITVVEQRQALDTLSRTILMFDYAMYFITKTYQEQMRQEIDRKTGAIRLLQLEGPAGDGKQTEGMKKTIMTILLMAAVGLTYYCHAVLGTGVIFTHLLYIPIVLASVWWKRTGVIVSLFLGAMLMLSNVFFLEEAPFADDLIRACMFVLISAVIALLSEGLTTAKELYAFAEAKRGTE
ncbi:MAG: hypothetical protein JW950_09370 [Deltaproteobacteria bacterium]|nr:hypothetical protein [Deltaproteobacteria bacterium]